MENQHRKISGYRELDQTEIDLMNKIKALGPQIEDVIEEVRLHLINQHQRINEQQDTASEDRMKDATPERFVELSKTNFQTALMYLTRAVAQPTFF
jgi:hypothetical protein